MATFVAAIDQVHTRSKHRCLRITLAVALTLLLAGLSLPIVWAQTNTSDALDEINSAAALARLSDAQVRELLLERLAAKKSAGAQAEGFNPAISAWRAQRKLGAARERLAAILGAWRELPEELRRAWEKLTAAREQGSFAGFLLTFLAAIVLGLLAEWWARRGLNRVRDGLALRPSETLGERAATLSGLFLVRGAGIVVFLLAMVIVFFTLTRGGAQDRTTFVFYASALAVVRFVSAFAAVFFAPRYPKFRLPLYSDAQASRLHRGVNVSVILVAFGFFTCALFGTLGVGGDAHPLLLMIVGTVFVVAMMATVYSGRRAIAHDLAGNDASSQSLRQICASMWPWVLMLVILALWLGVVYVALTGGTPLYGAAILSIAILLFWPTTDAAFEREAIRSLAAEEDVKSAMMRVARLLLFVVSTALLAYAWRINLLSIAEGGLGTKVTGAVLQIGVILLVAYIVWQAARIWIDKRIAAEDAELAAQGHDAGEMEIGGEGLSRMRTLLPLLRMTIGAALTVMVVMITLSALGIDIGPLLAGAGVVGLAIGFGSQTLVRDVVSGVFFLVDDAFRLGEYVDVGDVKGTVEKISIRSLRLRHHRGAVHTVPFGEVNTLTNYSRDWAIMKLKFRLPFDTDVEKVRKLLKKVGQELLEHPEVGEDFLQPFKSQGVLEVDDYGLVVRAKFMCKPGRQFLIRRHAYVAVQRAFSDNGVEFAQPEIKVIVGEDDDENGDTSRRESETTLAVSGAAAQAAIARGGVGPPQPDQA